MHNAGRVALSLWAGLNFLVAGAVTVLTLLHHPAPALALVMNEAEVRAVEPKVLGVVQAQAAFANPLIMALCALVLVLVWTRMREYWLVLTATLLPLQAFGFVSDSFLGGTHLVANSISTIVLVMGLSLSKRAPMV